MPEIYVYVVAQGRYQIAMGFVAIRIPQHPPEAAAAVPCTQLITWQLATPQDNERWPEIQFPSPHTDSPALHHGRKAAEFPPRLELNL